MSDLYNYIDPPSVRIVVKNLSQSQDAVGQRLGLKLQNSLDAWQEPIHANIPSPMRVLSETVATANLVKMVEWRDNYLYMVSLLDWGNAFFARILRNLRDLICGSKRSHGKLGQNSQAVLAALGTFIAHEFHLDSATAAGLAALVLITLGKATKKAFCEMTDEEVLKSLARSA